MTHLDQLFAIIITLFDHNRALSGLVSFFAFGILADLANGISFRELKSERWRRLIAYTAAILLAQFLDYMLLNDLMKWEYQSRLLATLALAGREGTKLLDYIAKEGIDIPFLRNRLKKMMVVEANDESVDEIRRLAAELRVLRETRAASPQQSELSSDAAGGPTI